MFVDCEHGFIPLCLTTVADIGVQNDSSPFVFDSTDLKTLFEC